MNPTARLRWLVWILLVELSLLTVVLSTYSLRSAARALKKSVSAVAITPNRPLTAPVSTPPAPTPSTETPEENFTALEQFEFVNEKSLAAWEEKVFKGKSSFRVLSEDGRGYLNTVTKDACSGLYVKVDHLADPSLYLSWRWRAKAFPKKSAPEKLANKKEDDFAARVYAIFPGSNYFKSDVIEYIWDETHAPGTAVESPYSGRVQLFVLRSGPRPQENGGWYFEQRNIHDDYVKLFGKQPTRALGAVALMSDSDNTEAGSEADFADIQIKTKIEMKKEKGGTQ